MLRRGFLKSLGAAGIVSAALPLFLPDELEELLKPVNKIFLPPANGWVSSKPDVIRPSVEQLFDMTFYGMSKFSEAAIIRVSRPGSTYGDVLNLSMNANGGIVRWCAVPGEEICGPVVISKPSTVDAYLVGRDKAGRLISDHNGARALAVLSQPTWSSAVAWEEM